MFKIAIAGLGWWGKVIINRLSNSKKVKIVFLIDPQPDNEAKTIAKSKNLTIYNNFEEAVLSCKLDGIILCTPNTLHMKQTIFCAKYGINVYCEKPLSLKPVEAKKMIDVCNQNNIILGVGHERRFEKGWLKLKDLVSSEVLGKIMYAEAHFSHDKLAGLSKDNWRANPKIAPAAGMTAMGVHLTDLMIWLFGSVEKVFATTSKRILKFKTGDVVSATLLHKDGLSSQITAILKTPHYQRVTIFGDKGWVELIDSSHPDTPGPSELILRMNNGKIKKTNLNWTDTVSANINNFINAVQRKKEYIFTDEEKFQNVAVLDAINKSSLKRKVINIK